MIDFGYFHRGLSALARSHPAGGMAGHLGAAVMAGYFFGEMHSDLPPGVRFAIERELERIMGGEEAIWFNQEKTGIRIPDLFVPLPQKEAGLEGDKAAGKIADAVSKNIGKLRQSGHNVIFASIAMRGLAAHPEFGTDEITNGLTRLMATFNNQGPGKARLGDRGLRPAGELDLSGTPEPKYDTPEDLAVATLEELIASASIKRQGLGGLHHLLDHAAAIIEFSDQGYHSLAEQGIPAHRMHLRMMQALPEIEGSHVAASEDPFTPEYWERRESVQFGAWLTHRIKSLYGFSVVAGAIEDEQLTTKAAKAMRYLLA